MIAFPQLRVRTEFSFPRQAYGPTAAVVDRLKQLQAPAAAIVNAGGGCWGHARFEKSAVSAGIEPIFGAEFFVTRGATKPTAWVLGLSPADVYRFCSGPETTPEAMAAAKGLIRFSGSALDDPECFDYVDVSPNSPIAQRRAVQLSQKTGKPLALVGDNRCPAPEHVPLMQALVDRSRDGLQWLENPEGMRPFLRSLSDEQFAAAVANSIEIGERLRGQRIPKAPIIRLDGDLTALCLAGKESRLARGHIACWTAEYQERLERELALISEKQFESYFLMVSDLVRWAKTKMLVGPARGSSAGSLVCYLIDITEVDPMVHRLLFERFIAPERMDLPDIDIDFSDVRRDMVFDYLVEKYGRERVARLGNINTFKPNSVLTHIGKRLGIPIPETFAVKNVLFEYTSGDSRYGHGLMDTLTGTAPGQKFSAEHPAFLPLAVIEGHATHTGVHAAGVVVCNEPITNFCAVNSDGVAQIDKPDAEYLNLLKIDALGLRTLGILEDSGVVTPEQLYGLPLNDQAVLDVFNQKKMAGIFQFEGSAQRSVAAQIQFTSFQQLDHVTALARPGPLGGGGTNTYIRRHQGLEPVSFKHESMREYLSDALGVVLYQEQVLRIGREVGQLDWKELSEMRKAMSSRKGTEYFDKLGAKFKQGAANTGMKSDEADDLWSSIVTYGAWAMNMCAKFDTKVRLANHNPLFGNEATLEELYQAYVQSPSNWIRQRKMMPVLLAFDGESAKPAVAVAIHKTGAKACVRLKFSGGIEVECTKDHRFIINGQWLACGEAKIGDEFLHVARQKHIKNHAEFSGSGWRKGRKIAGKLDVAHGRVKAANAFKRKMSGRACEDCGALACRMEAHHNDFVGGKDRADDLSWLCSSCHKLRHKAAGNWGSPMSRGWSIDQPSTLVSVEEIGVHETYDIEMPSPHHNYVLANGIVTHNSHTVSYAIISYWCAWVKHYHPLEFAAATLRSAKSDEQVLDLLRELHKEGIGYVAVDADESEVNWSVKDGRLVGGLMNAVGFGPAKAIAFIEARKNGTLTDKQRDALAEAEIKFKDLFPLHSAYGEYYENPEAMGIRRGTTVKSIAELAEGEHAVVIVRLVAKIRRDANETILVKKRNGRRYSGNTLFLDMKVLDDSTSMPLTLRVDRSDWQRVGERLADGAIEGKDCFLVRGTKLKGFPMISVDKIKCLTNPELTNEIA